MLKWETFDSDLRASPYLYSAALRETLIKSLSDFILGFLYRARRQGGANSELFKEDVDDAMYKNPYEI